jgi:hypothetical protein
MQLNTHGARASQQCSRMFHHISVAASACGRAEAQREVWSPGVRCGPSCPASSAGSRAVRPHVPRQRPRVAQRRARGPGLCHQLQRAPSDAIPTLAGPATTSRNIGDSRSIAKRPLKRRQKRITRDSDCNTRSSRKTHRWLINPLGRSTTAEASKSHLTFSLWRDRLVCSALRAATCRFADRRLRSLPG